jgi:hypothetical protein
MLLDGVEHRLRGAHAWRGFAMTRNRHETGRATDENTLAALVRARKADVAGDADSCELALTDARTAFDR